LCERRPLHQLSARQFFQAGGTDDPVFVLGNALAAETLPALRAAGHGFAEGMVETTLMGQILHGSARG
jgi:hypothetical protein